MKSPSIPPRSQLSQKELDVKLRGLKKATKRLSRTLRVKEEARREQDRVKFDEDAKNN